MIRSGNNTTQDGELMNNLSTLLEYLNEEVDEAAKTIDDASADRLALYVVDNSSDRPNVVLYSPLTAINTFDRLLKSTGTKLTPGWQVGNQLTADGALIGFLEFEKNQYCDNDTYEVKLSAATNKYGPLMYDIALSYVYPNFLISDRESVSREAQSVWKHYLTNRPDVNHELISDLASINPESSCELPSDIWKKLEGYKKVMSLEFQIRTTINISKSEKQKLLQQITQAKDQATEELKNIPIAYKYQISQPINLNKLKANHNQFVKYVQDSIKKYDVNVGSYVYDMFDEATDKFFRDLYHR